MTLLPRLVFLHLDRSGGTSIINALRQIYESRGQTFKRTDTPVYGETDCYAGHFPFERVTHFANYLAVTVLRDPADRELSWLNKCATNPFTSLHQQLRVRTAQRDMDQYIRVLVNDGLYASRYTAGQCTLENAYCVLSSLDLVGVTSRLDEFYARLVKLLDVNDAPPLSRSNVSTNTFSWTPDQRQLVRSKLSDDRAIYLHALKLL